MKLNHPLIKVCGMRERQNILEVANQCPDMMGFIFYPLSKRYVGEDFIIPEISADIQKVGVFVDEEPEEVLRILKKHKLQIAQLHGKETPEICLRIKSSGFKVMKAFGVDEHFNFEILAPYLPVTDGFVFDTKTVLHGGSGLKFNWEILNSYTLRHPFLLSGGIKPEDMEVLQEFYHPQCIGFDINSGFETSAAFKNVYKLTRFFKQVRQ